MPAQNASVKPSTAPVHLGDTFGVTPNPNATRPATVAAIGNPYGGMQGPAVAPHGVVGSTGIGNGLKSGSNAGMVGKVAQLAFLAPTAMPQSAVTPAITARWLGRHSSGDAVAQVQQAVANRPPPALK
jgi:hypothetical protein